MDIILHCQNLLGSGHRVRTYNIAQHLHNLGHKIYVLDGGVTPPSNKDFTIITLPAIRAKANNLGQLCMENYHIASDFYMNKRYDVIRDIYSKIRPNLVIIEGFPLARHSLKNEYDIILSLSRQCHAVIVSSVRDILAYNMATYDMMLGKNQRKNAYSIGIINEYIDTLWVHGDSNFISLEASCPVWHYDTTWHDKIYYTGYVRGLALPPNITKRAPSHIVVSAGSGAVANNIKECALFIAKQRPDYQLLYMAGMHDDALESVTSCPNIRIIPAVPNQQYRHMLQQASCVVGQAGYNSVVDNLLTGVPSILYPYQDYGEVEQYMRGSLLHNKQLAYCLDADYDEQLLLDYVDKACHDPYNIEHTIMLTGEDYISQFIKQL